jgi:hypothetical protein
MINGGKLIFDSIIRTLSKKTVSLNNSLLQRIYSNFNIGVLMHELEIVLTLKQKKNKVKFKTYIIIICHISYS